MAEKRQNKWLLKKNNISVVLLQFPQSSKFPKKCLWRHVKIFAKYLKGFAVFSIHKAWFPYDRKDRW